MNKFKYALIITITLSTPFNIVKGQSQNNPIIQTKHTADPAPMVYNDTVYLYTGHDEDDAKGFKMFNWLLYTSTDMVNWTDHGPIASLKDFSWVPHENGAWAAQCIERNNKFYLYCPMPGGVGIGVLVADTPYGPFKDPIGKPLIKYSNEDIDPSVFIDDDGQAYLYWGNPNLYYVKLNEDMISYSGDIIKDEVLAKVDGQQDPFHYQEGPWVYKRNNNYYMAYATTCCPEGIGYAMSNSPTGPWKFQGYIMKPNGTSPGNHPGIIDYKGNSYIFGFNWALHWSKESTLCERRSVCVDKMTYNEDGTIQLLPHWSTSGVEPVGTLNPYTRVEAETIAFSEGLKTERDSKGGIYVTSVHNDDYIKVRAVNFNKGAKSFEISAASSNGGKIEIRLDNRYGPLIGICEIDNTGGWKNWKTFSANVKKTKGIHDLFFVFKGDDKAELFNLDYWRFNK